MMRTRRGVVGSEPSETELEGSFAYSTSIMPQPAPWPGAPSAAVSPASSSGAVPHGLSRTEAGQVVMRR